MQRNRKLRLGMLAALAGVMIAVGCGSPIGVLPNGDPVSGRLKVLITDAPFPFDLVEEALVTITRVEVHYAGDGAVVEEEGGDDDRQTPAADDASEDADAKGDEAAAKSPHSTSEADDDDSDNDEGLQDTDVDESDSPWILIYDDQDGQTFDLLDLRDGKTDFLADAELPAGKYTQMRIHVSGGSILLTDGRDFDLRVPSGDTSGIKLHFQFQVEGDAETTLLLDVDLEKAFKPVPAGPYSDASEIREFHFSPSLAMSVTEVESDKDEEYAEEADGDDSTDDDGSDA
ncbi:MAG: DUF4382 domain-containing protein [Planctomycetota bacterium]|nr:DUF4382 domain-containing protein [Planctomycetota bacterium]